MIFWRRPDSQTYNGSDGWHLERALAQPAQPVSATRHCPDCQVSWGGIELSCWCCGAHGRNGAVPFCSTGPGWGVANTNFNRNV